MCCKGGLPLLDDAVAEVAAVDSADVLVALGNVREGVGPPGGNLQPHISLSTCILLLQVVTVSTVEATVTTSNRIHDSVQTLPRVGLPRSMSGMWPTTRFMLALCLTEREKCGESITFFK